MNMATFAILRAFQVVQVVFDVFPFTDFWWSSGHWGVAWQRVAGLVI